MNRMRKFYCILFFLGNIISTKLGSLICTFPSQLSTFCILQVILRFHKVRAFMIPLTHSIFLACLFFWDAKCDCSKNCMSKNLSIVLQQFFFHLAGLELILVVVFLHHLIRITTQLLVHTLHFCLLLCLLEKDFFSHFSLILYNIFLSSNPK